MRRLLPIFTRCMSNMPIRQLVDKPYSKMTIFDLQTIQNIAEKPNNNFLNLRAIYKNISSGLAINKTSHPSVKIVGINFFKLYSNETFHLDNDENLIKCINESIVNSYPIATEKEHHAIEALFLLQRKLE